MFCKEIMSKKVFSCKGSETVRACAKIMKQKNVGFVPVLDKNEKIIGVVTDRDLVIRAIAKNKSPSTPVLQVMTRKIISCGVDDQIADVEYKMTKYQKSRVVVLDKNRKCLGVISLADVANLSKNTERVIQAVTRRENRFGKLHSDLIG